MANPATLTLTELVGNTATNQPAGDTIDTAGTVPLALGGVTNRVVLHVTNSAANALTLSVKAGTNPPALRAGLGDLVVALGASGSGTDKKVIGPFESARFIQADGSLSLNFAPATGAPNLNIKAYRLPKAV